MNNKSLMLIFLFSFFIGCCSQSMIISDSSVTIVEADCWLNLMPGGNPSFHYSGTFSIDKKFIDDYKFLYVKVFYKDEMIHQSQPLLQFYDELITDTTSLVRFHFYSDQGIKVTDKMMKAESVDLLLVFQIKDNTVEKLVKEIPLTRAY
ncbi:MAG: hypothetical protein K6T54_13680 [Ignavibacterium sp.]|nr:hypothetical protein [Ignavibacterium sp.]